MPTPTTETIQVCTDLTWFDVEGILGGERIVNRVCNDPYIAGQYVGDALARGCKDIVVHVKTN